MDIVAASPEPPMIHDPPPAKLAVASHVPDAIPPIEPFDLLEDSPRIRTKLRLYAILAALYVAIFLPPPPSRLSKKKTHLYTMSLPLKQKRNHSAHNSPLVHSSPSL